MERTPLAGVGLGSAEDYSSLTGTRQILYYYKALFTKGQFLHFIAACKRLPDFTSIWCTSDFTPVCFVLRSGKLMLCISKSLLAFFVLFFFFFNVIHSYFTMIAIELYKLIRQAARFVQVLYSCVPCPFALGRRWCPLGHCLHPGMKRRVPPRRHPARREVPRLVIEWVWPSLWTSSLTDSGSGCEVKRTTHSHVRKHFQLGWLVFLLPLRKLFLLFPPEVLTECLWLQYWDILSFKTIVYDFLDL